MRDVIERFGFDSMAVSTYPTNVLQVAAGSAVCWMRRADAKRRTKLTLRQCCSLGLTSGWFAISGRSP